MQDIKKAENPLEESSQNTQSFVIWHW